MPAVENSLGPCRKPKSTIYGWTLAKIAMAIWFQVSGVRPIQLLIDLKILHAHIVAVGNLVSPLILKPDT